MTAVAIVSHLHLLTNPVKLLCPFSYGTAVYSTEHVQLKLGFSAFGLFLKKINKLS